MIRIQDGTALSLCPLPSALRLSPFPVRRFPLSQGVTKSTESGTMFYTPHCAKSSAGPNDQFFRLDIPRFRILDFYCVQSGGQLIEGEDILAAGDGRDHT